MEDSSIAAVGPRVLSMCDHSRFGLTNAADHGLTNAEQLLISRFNQEDNQKNILAVHRLYSFYVSLFGFVYHAVIAGL